MEGTDLPNEITDGDDQFVYVRYIGGGGLRDSVHLQRKGNIERICREGRPKRPFLLAQRVLVSTRL
jgi:hypothetical protein